MPLDYDQFVSSRTHAYHVCGVVNFEIIRKVGSLRSASTLLCNTAFNHLLSFKRAKTQDINIEGTTVQIRDHKPLIEANIEWMDDYDLAKFLTELNSRVFLWAGNKSGPCQSGRNHIQKYHSEGEVKILKVTTAALLSCNDRDSLEISFCNSGSARQNAGIKVKRGRSTFQPLSTANRRPGEVVEITFKHSARLPRQTQYANSLAGPWLPLFADA